MIMWFGVGPGSKIALGTLSCFFPIALVGRRRHAPDRQGADPRRHAASALNTWQMVTKIYLPAMRQPIINGVRLGLGVAHDRHAAGRDQAVQPRHRLPDHPGLQHVRHAAHVCHADRAVRARRSAPTRWSAAPAGASAAVPPTKGRRLATAARSIYIGSATRSCFDPSADRRCGNSAGCRPPPRSYSWDWRRSRIHAARRGSPRTTSPACCSSCSFA